MADRGLLVIVKAKDCGACIRLEEEGFFKSLLHDVDDLDVEDVYIFDIDHRGPMPGYSAIMNIDTYFPNFKFMFRDTYEKALESGSNWQSVYQDIRFFNRVMNEENILVPSQRYEGGVTFANLKRFCDDSRRSLLEQRRVPVTAQRTVVKARYNGKDRR